MSVKKDNILITGSNGLLGQALRLLLEKNNYSVIATALGNDRLFDHHHTYVELDVSSSSQCYDLLAEYQPSVIINAAACTNVDQCEIKQDDCLAINTESIVNFMRYAQKHNAHFIQISTDFVFDGIAGNYRETDNCNPLNFYGFSKLEAENILINSSSLNYTIIRTSLIYGPNGSNFFTSMKKKLESGIELNIVDDQYRTPTYVVDLALSTMQIIKFKKYGIYHISSGESLSIFNIVCNIAEYLKQDVSRINRIKSSELDQIAIRPFDSTLNIDKAVRYLNFIPNKLNDTLNNIL
tara:strand:- start:4287 stop:5171 length:885 start_codon:yes stop_codon:yes gene_type:complete